MRNLLIGILIIVLLVLAGYMLMERVNIGNLEILGIEAIAEKNDELDQKILDGTKLATVTYKETLDTLDSANRQLQQEKQAYENYVSTDNGTGAVSQIQSYEVEYLWTKIGNYAKREGVILKMDVAINNAVLGTYDLNFNVTGTYVGITEFIYDLDNDSSLLFKVENFKLLPNAQETTQKQEQKEEKEDSENESTTQTNSTLVATFTCKDISINIDSSSISENINIEANTTQEQNTETNNKAATEKTQTNTTVAE